MTDDNKVVVRRAFEEVWNQRNLAVIDELVGPNWTHDDSNTPDFGRGPEAFRKAMNLYLTAFPDLKFTVTDMVAEGDKVVSRYTASGTHKGEFNGIPPTNKSFTVTGTFIDTVENGKLSGVQINWDALGLLRQLGITPAVGRGRAA
jgi:steroid delta-isomerase-like uncharacterized protein